MKRIIVVEPARQGGDDGGRVGFRVHRHVVAFEGSDEGFRHAVRLRAFDRRREGLKSDVAGKPSRLMRDVAGAIVRQPFDRRRQAVDAAEAMLKGPDLPLSFSSMRS